MKILYIEDDPRDAELTKRALMKTTPVIRLETVDACAKAIARLDEQDVSDIDLVLTDMRLPDGDGLDILMHVRERNLPMAVVAITGSGDEETVVAVMRAGADDYVVKRGDYLERLPVTLETALAHYRAGVARRTAPLRVLYAEHNSADIDLTCRHLDRHAPYIQLQAVHAAAEVLDRLPAGKTPRHDVLLLDYRLPGMCALEIIKEVRQTRGLDIPIILVTGQGDEETALQALKLGACDYIPKHSGYLFRLSSALENAYHRAQLYREQQALRASEEKYRDLVENINDVIYTTDYEGRITYISPVITAITGYAPVELMGRRFSEFIHADDLPKIAEAFQQVLSGRLEPQDYRIMTNTGRYLWVRSYSKPIISDGRPIGLRGLLSDITKRKLAEEDLKLFFNVALDMLCIANFEGYLIRLNAAWSKTLGWTEEELISRPFIEFVHPEDRESTKAATVKLAEGVDVVGFDNRYRCKDGTYKWISWNSFGVVDRGLIIAAAHDVTDRRLAEEQLRHQKEFLQTMMDNIPLAVSMMDADGRYIWVNRAWERTIGWTLAEAQSVDLLAEMYPDPQYRRSVKEFILKAEGQWKEIKVRVRNGDIRDFQRINVFLSDGAIIGIGEDITERKRAEQKHHDLEHQLYQAQKMESVGRLAGGVAHDFNNLLTIILGNGELLMEDVPVDHPHANGLKEIQEAAVRAKNLTRQLLAFGRKQLLEIKVVDLNKVVLDFENMIRRLIGEDIVFSVLPSGLPVCVKADISQMEQILLNLAVNARDAMPDGGDLTIETRIVEMDDDDILSQTVDILPGPYARIDVRDSGIGMDGEMLKRIFEPFFTTKGKDKGTGLGLATVYGIVKQHGGDVRVSSVPDQGSVFTIYLPRVLDDADETAVAAADTDYLKHTGVTILVVEDDISVRRLTCDILRHHGYMVIESASVDDVIDMARGRKEPIHLLLSDVNMPGMKGPDVYQRVVKHHPETRVLYMSGYTEDQFMHLELLEQGVPFVQKPFSISVLVKKVTEALSR